MADIIKLDMTNVADTQLGVFQTTPGQFELTDYTNNGTLELAAARVEYIGEFPYRVESGDLAITDGLGASAGLIYVHVKDDGDGTASAYTDTNKGTFDPNKGGWYHVDGAKVVFKMTKTSSVYYNKGRMTNKIVDARLDDDTEQALLFSLIF